MNATRQTLAQQAAAYLPSRAARQAAGVLAFATLTAVGAKVALPIPGTPVPFTFQVFAVLLAGALLGARLGAASQLLYLAAGAAGLPVFAGVGGLHSLIGPTGGYLLAFPLAAFAVGALAAPALWRGVAAVLAGLVAIYAGGLAWLAAWGSFDLAVAFGLRPFLVADLVKAGLVVLVMRRYRDDVLRFVAR